MSKVCNFICDSTYEIVSFRYVLVVQSQGTSGLPGTYCLVNVPVGVAEANVLPQADCSNTGKVPTHLPYSAALVGGCAFHWRRMSESPGRATGAGGTEGM